MEPAVVKDLFVDEIHKQIVSYVEKYVPMMPLGVDSEEFNRRYAHNVPFFVDIHQSLTDFASEQFGEKLKPSYVFLSMYDSGGYCPLHIDRPQCYRTVDYLISASDPEPWPIYVGPLMTDDERDLFLIEHPKPEDERESLIQANKWDEVLLNPNDAVLYSGTHSLHYRNKIKSGSANLAFFHFVKEDFDGPLS